MQAPSRLNLKVPIGNDLRSEVADFRFVPLHSGRQFHWRRFASGRRLEAHLPRPFHRNGSHCGIRPLRRSSGNCVLKNQYSSSLGIVFVHAIKFKQSRFNVCLRTIGMPYLPTPGNWLRKNIESLRRFLAFRLLLGKRTMLLVVKGNVPDLVHNCVVYPHRQSSIIVHDNRL